jgi:hypothetical protein
VGSNIEDVLLLVLRLGRGNGQIPPQCSESRKDVIEFVHDLLTAPWLLAESFELLGRESPREPIQFGQTVVAYRVFLKSTELPAGTMISCSRFRTTRCRTGHGSRSGERSRIMM